MPSSSSVRCALLSSRMRIVAPSPRWVGRVVTRRSMRRLLDRDADPAVLRHPLLGDVELAHDLQPRDHRADHPLRHVRRLLQHAVDAEADPQLALFGLEVDVGGPLPHRLGEDAVDELDHRRVLGAGLHVADRGRASRPRPPAVLLDDRLGGGALQGAEPASSASTSASAATAMRQSSPVAIWMSSTASTLAGSAAATSSVC